ncbi:hypothetical protein NKR23_g5995 [Pleurostoma richardsiae]|uniref:Uncharacterized protein n=1 Tax=Pleurostoma richardsiae TaxID=41990 RepID=A0AA38VIQ4_9PEZI|nr:hypothetical protein NKR23_g5995 [Pleurostoma richardsiae]
MQLQDLLHLTTMHACLGSALSIRSNVKRGAETNATLYAYGANTSAWPIAYGLSDGLLYITETPDNADANLTPLSWDLASITGENWIANATFLNGTSAGSMYILPQENNAVGVLPMARATDVNGTVSGFALFASQLVYNNNTYLEAQFWGRPTETSGIYSLCWIVDGAPEEGSFPVVIKGVEA